MTLSTAEDDPVETSAVVTSDASPGAAADGRLCQWCRGPIPASMRADARYCKTPCRQAAHRFGRGQIAAVAAGTPRRIAYADPPYPDKAHIYAGHPDYAGEVDHRALIAELVDDFPDGWALSTSAAALPMILGLCHELGIADEVRVAAWFRGHRVNRSAVRPVNGWEPVLVYRGRLKPSPGDLPQRIDALVYPAKPRITDPDRVIGAKPAEFIWWLFELLGLEAHDELVDLFPGSGGISRAWELVQASHAPGGDTSSEEVAS